MWLLGFNIAGWLLTFALVVGILCDCEGLLVSFLLDESAEDVPTIFHAVRLRREQRAHREKGTAAASARVG